LLHFLLIASNVEAGSGGISPRRALNRRARPTTRSLSIANATVSLYDSHSLQHRHRFVLSCALPHSFHHTRHSFVRNIRASSESPAKSFETPTQNSKNTTYTHSRPDTSANSTYDQSAHCDNRVNTPATVSHSIGNWFATTSINTSAA